MRFRIDDHDYDFPILGTFDMDENRIFYRATGMHAEDAWLGLQENGGLSFADLMKNEGFLGAMAHIAYRREHEDMPEDVIFTLIGKQKRLDLIGSLYGSIADESEDPKESGTTSVPSESSTSSTSENDSTPSGSQTPSGKPSSQSSDPPADDPETTGIIASGSEPEGSVPLRQVV